MCVCVCVCVRMCIDSYFGKCGRYLIEGFRGSVELEVAEVRLHVSIDKGVMGVRV